MPETPFPLGRVVEHDPRSLAFPAEVAAVTSKLWQRQGPVLDQGRLGSCTGNAMAHCLNTTPHSRVGHLFDQDDAVALYSMATVLDSFPGTYPPTDTGSSGLAVAKAAQQAGYIKGYGHAFGLDMALGALMLSPVLVGINWYQGMFTPDSDGFVTISGDLAGGHEVLLVGVQTVPRVLWFLNSWSSRWGKNGFFHMTYATFDRLLHEQGDVTIPVVLSRAFPGVLWIGSQGMAVAEVQQVVNADADGKFGILTAAAVKAWQRGHGLVVDGIVGPMTWAKMFT